MPGGRQPEPLGVYDQGEGVCRPVAKWEHSCSARGLVAAQPGGTVLATYTPGPMGIDDRADRAANGIADLALARGLLFVVVEQLPDVGVGGKIIRKVLIIPKDFSLAPRAPGGTLTIAEHVMGGMDDLSQFLSASDRPFGAPSIDGKPVLIDTVRARAAGAQIHTVDDLVKELKRFADSHPSARARLEKLIWAVEKIEGEVLIEGSVPAGGAKPVGDAHLATIRSAEGAWRAFKDGAITKAQLEAELQALSRAYQKAKVIGRVGRVLSVVGVVMTAVDVARASRESLERRSWKPIGAEAIRQVGGWGGAIAGAKIGFVGGALFGIETGPGAIITGGVGAIIFGAAGYFGMDLLADQVSEN